MPFLLINVLLEIIQKKCIIVVYDSIHKTVCEGLSHTMILINKEPFFTF